MPAVEVMLTACLAYTLSTCCQLLLDEKLTKHTDKLALRAASLVLAVVLFALVRGRAIIAVSLISTPTSLRCRHRRNTAPPLSSRWF